MDAPDGQFTQARIADAGTFDLFPYPGSMAAAMRVFDWSSTPLGPVQTWPLSLVTAVRLMLQCRLPMYIAWGPQHIQLYNDAYVPILGAKHPSALGACAPDTWHEIWPVIGPMWQQVWNGESIGFDDFKLTIDRYGYSEDCYFNFSYSAVPLDTGEPGGILVTFAETTAKVCLQRRQAFLLALTSRLRDLRDPVAISHQAAELLGTHLGVARVGYGEIDSSGAHVHVEQDWTVPGMASLAGQRRPLDSFGPAVIDALRRGEVLCLDDIGADPRSAPYAAGYASIGTCALLGVPIIKAGKLVALLYLHQATPHRWRDDDVELARDVAEQSWQAVERARAQMALQESEDHFRHTVTLNPDVQWTADRDGRIDRIAPRWDDWTGAHGALEWMGMAHPDDQAALRAAWAASLASGAPFDTQARIRLADGTYEWMHARAYARRNAAGAIVRWYGSTQNVQAYRCAQEQAERREQDFRTLAEAMPNQAWLADHEGQLYWFNRRVYDYSGYAEHELDPAAWASIVHPDDLPATMVNWSAALAKAAPYENEFRLRHGPSGQYRWFIARALPAPDPGTGKLRWIGTNTDVHEQKTLAHSLERINHSLEEEVSRRTADRDRMWRLSTDIMLVAKFDATIVAVNPAWHDMLGWSEGQLLGMPFLDLVHPDDVQATLDEAGKLARGLKTLHFENRYRHHDGSYRWLAWTAVPDQDYIHAVARDITREKQQRQALEQAELALRQSQKLESIGKLTGGVAHDFNNILQVVSGSLQLLQRFMGGNEVADKRLQTAMRAVERGAKLSSQLLAFARRQPLQPAAISPVRLLAEMDDLLRRALGESIEVKVVPDPLCWTAMVDQNQLENVLLNLAINGRDAMPDGGRLTIEVSNAELDDAYARQHQDLVPGQYVMFAVSDTGTGMTPQVLEQACEPFFTTKREGEGTGLGLSMAYGFVKQSGGHFRIYSEVGHGTTVRLYFPRSHAAEEVLPNLASQPVVGGDETILVVEDDPDVQATVVAMLGDLGYRVLKADDAQAALSILNSGAPVDLLFTDVVMPGTLRSPELARQAKLLHPHLEVLFTSGYAQNAIVHGGRLDPGVQLLSKPYSREQLARKLRHSFSNAQQARVALPGDGWADEPGANVRKASAGASTQRRILVVEDVAESRQLICDMLTLLGHVAHGVGSGEEAVQAFGHDTYDTLITDYRLPGMSGVDLAIGLKGRQPGLMVVFLTGYGSLFGAAPGFAYTLLSKPCDFKRLAALFVEG